MIKTSKKAEAFSMECIRPFAVYQTISGPVDSMGYILDVKQKEFLKMWVIVR